MGRSGGVLGKGAFVQHVLYSTMGHDIHIRHSMFIISSSDHIHIEMRKSLSVLCFINRQLPAANSSSIMVIHPYLSVPDASNAKALVLIHRPTTPITPDNARHLQ
jgi:hypothetical protein